MLNHTICQVFGFLFMLIETEKPPNKHTIAMGELIRKAREEAGLSQEQLAKDIYRRRLAVSEMENGKVEISAWTLPLLAAALNKPITYFFPSYILNQITPEKLSPIEQEILIHFRNSWDENIQKIAIDIVKVLSQFDPEELIIDSLPIISERIKKREELKNMLKKKS
jgi:transcriptional regulator with XRE-family HTH domain